MAAVVAAGGLAGCSRDDPKTTTAVTGSVAPAPNETTSTTASTTAPCTFSGSTDGAQGGGDAPTRLLTDVRVGAHGCFERVTFELKPKPGEADGPVGWKAAYESAPITEDGSGRPVKVKGTAFLVVTMTASRCRSQPGSGAGDLHGADVDPSGRQHPHPAGPPDGRLRRRPDLGDRARQEAAVPREHV